MSEPEESEEVGCMKVCVEVVLERDLSEKGVSGWVAVTRMRRWLHSGVTGLRSYYSEDNRRPVSQCQKSFKYEKEKQKNLALSCNVELVLM